MKNSKRLLAIVLSLVMMLCSVPMMVSADSADVAPAMANVHKNAVWSQEGFYWTNLSATGNTAIANGETQYSDFSATEKAIDTTEAEYLEFDVWSDVAVNNELDLWLSVAIWEDSGRALFYMPTLNAGWNHVVIDLSKVYNYANFTDVVYDRSIIRSMNVRGTPATEESVALNLKFANAAFTTDGEPTPKMNNTMPYAVATVEGKFWEKGGIAGNYKMPPVGGDNNPSWYGHFDAIDTTDATHFELDVYSTEATNIVLWVSSGAWADPGRIRTIDSVAVNAGWTHVCVPFTQFGYHSGTPNRAAIKNIFIETTTPEVESIKFAFANAAFTTNVPSTPKMSNTYPNALYTKEGVFWTELSVTGNTNIANNAASFFPRVNGGDAVDVTGAEYVEFDLWSDVEVTNNIKFWVSSNAWLESGRARYAFPTLKAGWNHVVIDLSRIETKAEWTEVVFDLANIKGFALEGTPATAENVPLNLRFANVAFTSAAAVEPDPDVPVDPDPEEPNTDDPAVAPEAKYEYNVVATNASDLAGSKTNNSDERYMNWDEYSAGFKPMMEAPLDITKGDYIEFDFYSSVKTKGGLSLGSINPSNGFQFYDNRSQRKEFEVNPGWNHIVLSTDGAFRSIDQTTLKTYTPTAVTGFILHGWGASDYIRLTNIAVTRDTPLPSVSYKNPIIDYADALNFEKYWAPGVTDTYGNVAERAFINLGKTIDASKAEFLEFDVWVDAPINNMTFWACNNFDMPGRYSYTADFSGLKIGEWNHIVLDITQQTNQAGAWDKTQWRHVFLQGGPTEGLETGVNFKIANIGCSKSYPDMKTTHTLVGVAVDGVHKGSTVPAGAGLYPAHQMWGSFSAIDVSKVDFIELDVYVSDSTSSFRIWSATDSAAVRGFWMIPELEAGWNHVVIEKTAVAGGNNGFSVATFTEWSGFFFEGGLSEDKDIEIKIANVAATKFAPDASYKFIEVTSHPEIYVDVTGTEEGFAGEGTFAAPVDFSKGDTIELDVYAPADASEVTVTLTDVNGATATIAIADLAEGWNHVILNVADIVAGEGFAIKNVASIAFAGADAARFVFANLAITAEEAVKFDMEYVGKVYNTFDGYAEANIPAGADIAESVDPIVLPWTVDVSEMGYVEFNLYVSAKCDLTLNLNATPIEEGDIYGQADAYYVLEGLTYGWNQIHVSLADLTANEWFDPTAVNYIYFSGVPAATYDVAFTVEDLALTTEAIDFDIAEGDYNVDGAVDMVDLIHVVNTTLAAEDVAFANVAEVAGAADYVIDALDIAGLRALLFAAF